MSQKFKTFIIQIVVVNDGICSKMTLNRKKSGEVYIQGEDEGILIEKIASENVAEMLNEWYSMIVQHNVKKAVEIKNEIEQTLPFMEENQNLVIYFTLLDFRHKMMIRNIHDLKDDLNYFEEQNINQTDTIIEYYYYFFAGQYNFYNRNFMQAIKNYELAENKLKLVSDPIEEAEFHYHLGQAYYRIEQHFLSLNHAKKALKIFGEFENYLEKELNSEMLLAANLVDLCHYDKAYSYYYTALKKAEEGNFKLSIALANFNLGLCYQRQMTYDLSITHFEEALKISEYSESSRGVRGIYELVYTLYKAKRNKEGHQLLLSGMERAKREEQKEALTKFKVIHACYELQSVPIIISLLDELGKFQLWTDVVELSYEIGVVFEERGNYEGAMKFYKKAVQAKTEVHKMSEVII
ncbi:tetratricopeptide repeat protein [Bacillus sp. A116_S68]|nr:tetratricopeptide repeat protein [Bacillus sp. A116_S68]